MGKADQTRLTTGWVDGLSVIEPQINAAGIHTWPFDRTFPLDVLFFVAEGPDDIRMNRHDYFELLYVFSGQGIFQLQERRLSVKTGDLLVIGSNLYHGWAERCSAVNLVGLFFQPRLIRGVEGNREDIEYLTPFLLQDSDFPYVVSSETGIPARVFDLIQEIQALLPVTSNRPQLTVRSCLKMILALLVNHYGDFCDTKEILHRREEALERLQPLFEFIERHYDKSITVPDAARILALSPSYFRRFFRWITGQSFHAYLTCFRIAKAQQLLTSTEKPISEISQEVGFCDQSNFGVVFRELMNMTPLVYRHKFSRSSQVASSHSVASVARSAYPAGIMEGVG